MVLIWGIVGPTQAIDIFTPDNPAGYVLQDKICAFIRNNVKRFGGRYHIRRHGIWNVERADEGYRDQGVTGNRTVDHMDHIHDTQYAFAPGPFGPIPDPQKPTAHLGEDMLVFNVKGIGIFFSRGDRIQHLQHPDHVMEFVKIGVPYQDKAELSKEVAQAYLGILIPDVDMGMVVGLDEFPPATSLEKEYQQMLVKVRAGVERMKEEYYDMMLSEG